MERWEPAVEQSAREQRLLKLAGKSRRLFVFLREHRHFAIRFVTPEDRRFEREHALLVRRREVYQCARTRHPERWSRNTRNWTPMGPVCLGHSPNLTPAVQAMKRIG
ncbi:MULTISPECIES: hypothetical protein [Myxococcus]|uniref:Uncharacterized protein n=1 Tax=Myxococcus xanthus TaxID=34 RepID=A0AAE6G3F7_MYXXA|nr:MULTISPECIES: hypothetical protein [Myxococcus]QDE70248.1 hypothetical protein BHS09_26570 [Myxococcus xanthus]QDE77527.1 hypothetical protein BHS08_26590 [Myxococcus xanthus]QDE99073.1 hypothetical protein BHS05_26385 [Myxococcus xanthus]WAM30468.1 hypothetical protein OZ403_27945 [Myxococcus sp. NMCA1]